MDRSTQLEELKRILVALEAGSADVKALKNLALLCSDNAVPDGHPELFISSSSFPDSPTPAKRTLGNGAKDKSIWDEEKIFDQTFDALLSYLTLERVCIRYFC